MTGVHDGEPDSGGAGEEPTAEPSGRGRRPSLWLLPLALVAVSAIVLTLALITPFEPEQGAAPVAAGDPVRGGEIFDRTCASCHGPQGAGGGIGPKLAGLDLTAEQVAGKIAAGGGAMPANLVEGADRDDVAAYVVSLGTGQAAAPAPETTAPAPSTAAPESTVSDDAAVAQGQEVFAGTCASCHGELAEGGVGPALAGATLTPDQIRATIQSGKGIMPADLVEGEELDQVVAFVTSLTAGGGEPATSAEAETTGEATTAEAAPSTEETEAQPAAPAGTLSLTGAGLIGLQLNLDAPAEVDATVFLVGPQKKLEVGRLAVGDLELEVDDAGVGTILDGYDTVVVGPDAEQPLSTAALTGAVDAMRELNVSSQAAPDGGSLIAASRGQVKVLRDHVRFLRESLRDGNLVNVRFHGEHLVNIVRGEPLQNLDGLGGASNPGDGVGLIGQGQRVGYLQLIETATNDIANAEGADELAAGSAATVGENAAEARRLLADLATNAATCAKAPTLARAGLCVRTIARLETQIVPAYQQITRFAARVPVFSLDAFQGG